AAWGKRACTYFVYDPVSRLFAPSKFCAYTPVPPAAGVGEQGVNSQRMTTRAYSELNDGTHIMDGQRAWRHLVNEIRLRPLPPAEAGSVSDDFTAWLDQCGEAISVRGSEATFLTPPTWYVRDSATGERAEQ